mmetsp:Transcript_35826/g.78432  ORF Transcript_35826/g.78432 Transcript_35826/m.78432 type:complete len:243 (+) Transcript_35826:200-928(+)
MLPPCGLLGREGLCEPYATTLRTGQTGDRLRTTLAIALAATEPAPPLLAQLARTNLRSRHRGLEPRLRSCCAQVQGLMKSARVELRGIVPTAHLPNPTMDPSLWRCRVPICGYHRGCPLWRTFPEAWHFAGHWPILVQLQHLARARNLRPPRHQHLRWLRQRPRQALECQAPSGVCLTERLQRSQDFQNQHQQQTFHSQAKEALPPGAKAPHRALVLKPRHRAPHTLRVSGQSDAWLAPGGL